ncbi:MAG: methyltransferase domain-containing protein [Desulfuromonadales bacterium]
MKTSSQGFGAVEAHYSHDGLEASILAALVAAGKDPDNLKPEDLAPFDEFHVRGRKATLELARELNLSEGMKVLDVGSGVGGPSRCLAQEFGCLVTGIDLCSEYCRVASMLARRLGLDSLVTYRHGNALDMPFEDAAFDLLWTQHAAMNIADKDRFYAEMRRVLKPGGSLAIYDVLDGEGGAPHYPLPWARDPSTSFLLTSQQMRNSLEKEGFVVQTWRDKTETARFWFRNLSDKIRVEGDPPLGIHLLLGSDFRVMAQNLVRNLEENRVALIEAVVRCPA